MNLRRDAIDEDGAVKRFLGILVLAFAVFSEGCGDEPASSPIDFSGVDRFWPVYSKLADDILPSDAEWEALFCTPGYEVLTASEFDRDYFKRYFALAFKPSRKSELEEELRQTHWRVQYLEHLTRIGDNVGPIKDWKAHLESDAGLLHDALAMTQEYLPHAIDAGGDPPPISFVFFGNDARGYSRIVVDILFCMENEEFLKYLIAHEAHHYYRNNVLTFNFPEGRDVDHEIVWALSQLQAEGIADQIDKRATFFGGGLMEESEWAVKFRNCVDDSPRRIARLDSLLSAHALNPSNPGELRRRLKEILPMSGHPTGYYMARMIIDNLGKDTVLEHMGDPFGFIPAYNDAVARSPEDLAPFSAGSVNLISALGKKYSRK